VAPDGQTPLDPLVRPGAADLEAALAEHRGRGRQRQPAGVERDECELQALALAPEEVLLRDADLREADDAVLDGPQPHEVAADDDLDARRRPLDDERRDLLRIRVPRHDDEEVGDRAVGAPELLAVENVVAFRRAGDGRREVGRIRADLRLGQGERRHGARREAGKVLLLLLLRPEELQRLRDADGLVRRQQRDEVAVARRDQLHRVAVLALREAQAAVLLRDLHPEGAELGEPLDDRRGNLPVPVDRVGIDLLDEKPLEARHVVAELGALGRGGRERMDEVEPEVAEEDLLQKRGRLPLALAGLFGDAACFVGADGLGGRFSHGMYDFTTNVPNGARRRR